jgi:hypothetical protein
VESNGEYCEEVYVRQNSGIKRLYLILLRPRKLEYMI